MKLDLKTSKTLLFAFRRANDIIKMVKKTYEKEGGESTDMMELLLFTFTLAANGIYIFGMEKGKSGAANEATLCVDDLASVFEGVNTTELSDILANLQDSMVS